MNQISSPLGVYTAPYFNVTSQGWHPAHIKNFERDVNYCFQSEASLALLQENIELKGVYTDMFDVGK